MLCSYCFFIDCPEITDTFAESSRISGGTIQTLSIAWGRKWAHGLSFEALSPLTGIPFALTAMCNSFWNVVNMHLNPLTSKPRSYILNYIFNRSQPCINIPIVFKNIFFEFAISIESRLTVELSITIHCNEISCFDMLYCNNAHLQGNQVKTNIRDTLTVSSWPPLSVRFRWWTVN